MRQDFRIVGSGGQGIVLLSNILAIACGVYAGLEVAQTQSYGPEARGGTCKAELVVSDEKIDYVKADKLAYFVVFNESSLKKFSDSILESTVIFADSTYIPQDHLNIYKKVYTIGATAIAEKLFKPFVANIIMLGFITAKLKWIEAGYSEQALKDTIPASVQEMNIEAFRYGYERGLA